MEIREWRIRELENKKNRRMENIRLRPFLSAEELKRYADRMHSSSLVQGVELPEAMPFELGPKMRIEFHFSFWIKVAPLSGWPIAEYWTCERAL